MSASDADEGKSFELSATPPALPLAASFARGVTPRLTVPSAVPNLPALLRALQRRLGLALFAGLVSALAVGAAAFYIVPPAKYLARSTLRVAMYRPKIIFETGEAKADYKTYQRTQVTMLKSRLVLKAVVGEEKVKELETCREVVRSQGDLIEWLEQQVVVEFPGSSEILQVSMSGDHPKDLQILVNTVVDKYMEKVVLDENNERIYRSERLRKLWDQYQEKLKEQRKNLRTLAVAAGSDDKQTLAFKNQLALETLAQARNEHLQIRSELARTKAEAAALESVKQEPESRVVPDEVIDQYVEQDPGVEQFKSKIESLTAKYNQVSRLTRNPSDPALVSVSRELDATRKSLAQFRQQLRARYANRLVEANSGGSLDERQKRAARIKTLEEFEKELGKEVERLSGQIGSLNENTLDLQAEQEQITLLGETAKKVGGEIEAMEVELQAPARIQVIDKASVPSTKDELKKAKTTALAAFGAFAIALAGVSFWEFQARRISTVDEVVSGLGLTLVGSIPALPARSARRRLGTADDQDHHNLMVESVDATRMMLLHASRTEGLRIVMVTSALEGEGKTSLSCHLATSLARAGRKTLLVDCDLRSPAAHRLLDVSADLGVCELLRGEVKLADAVQPTRATDLFVISAGHVDSGAIQALARGELQAIFDRLEPEFDFLVVDSAPVLPVADTLSVSQHVDAVIFSILRDVSRVTMVHSAYERLASLGVRILGAVVAGAPSQSHGSRYSQSVKYGESVKS